MSKLFVLYFKINWLLLIIIQQYWFSFKISFFLNNLYNSNIDSTYDCIEAYLLIIIHTNHI